MLITIGVFTVVTLMKDPKVIIVLPAYQARKTLERTIRDVPPQWAQDILLVDDASTDGTAALARSLNLHVVEHTRNQGYGANQKTCYQEALKRGAAIVVMLHPDYQYDPKIIPRLVEPILKKEADAVFGSRMMRGGALEGGMPVWKFASNVLLTAFCNLLLNLRLSEFHSGFRAYTADLLRTVKFETNSNNFVFDTQMIVQIKAAGLRIKEIPIQTRYFEDASTIKFWPCVIYGTGIICEVMRYVLHRTGLKKNARFEKNQF